MIERAARNSSCRSDRQHGRKQYRRSARRGAMLFFAFFVLFVVLVMVTFSVDIAYMHLVRAELRAATDAAAKATALELAFTEGDSSAATQVGIDVAHANKVGGANLLLAPTDFEFGHITFSDGNPTFQLGGAPLDAVRLTARRTSGSLTGPAQLFFGSFLDRETFSPTLQAIAAARNFSIVVALDRSHSMCWDESGVSRAYPPGIPAGADPVYYPPHEALSRWAAADRALNRFLTILEASANPPPVGLVTWASQLGRWHVEFLPHNYHWLAAHESAPISRNYSPIRTFMNFRRSASMIGSTNIAAGIDRSVSMLQSTSLRGRKFIILMTDGIENQGRGARNAANDAAAEGIIIHTITFLERADQTLMQQVAERTGGRHFHATDGESLEEVFDEIARMLPVSLIE